jgi:phosphoribosyl-ATP pyrophosphohydrolase/phosphoribosyl-AMP cyclohydrolase
MLELKTDANGLVPVVTQDAETGQVLMVAYTDKRALDLTLKTGQAHYFSRRRGEVWLKGATSGHTQSVAAVTTDCDSDALLYLVRPSGPACHTGARSCFDAGQRVVLAEAAPSLGIVLGELWSTIVDRVRDPRLGSRVSAYLGSPPDRVLRKVAEEGLEVALAGDDPASLIRELADLWFFSLVTLARFGLDPSSVAAELVRRRESSCGHRAAGEER